MSDCWGAIFRGTKQTLRVRFIPRWVHLPAHRGIGPSCDNMVPSKSAWEGRLDGDMLRVLLFPVMVRYATVPTDDSDLLGLLPVLPYAGSGIYVGNGSRLQFFYGTVTMEDQYFCYVI